MCRSLTSLTPIIIAFDTSLEHTPRQIHTRSVFYGWIHMCFNVRIDLEMWCCKRIVKSVFCQCLSPNHAQSTLGRLGIYMQIISKWITIYTRFFSCSVFSSPVAEQSAANSCYFISLFFVRRHLIETQKTHVGWFKAALVNGVEHEATRHTKVEIISSIFLMEHRVVARVHRMNNEHIYFKYGTKAHNDIVLSLSLFFSTFVFSLFSACSLSPSNLLALFEPRFTTPAMVIGLNVCYLLNVCKWRQFFYTNANASTTKKTNTFHATMLTMFRFFRPFLARAVHFNLNRWWRRPD